MLLQILLGWGKFQICRFAFRDSFFLHDNHCTAHFYITAEHNRSHIWIGMFTSFSFLLFLLFNFFKKGTSSKRQRHAPSGFWDFTCLQGSNNKFRVVSLRVVLSSSKQVWPEVFSPMNTRIWNKEGQLFKMLKHRKCTGHLVTGGGVHFGALASFIHSLKAK